MAVVEKHVGERCVRVAGVARATGLQLAGYSGDFIHQTEKSSQISDPKPGSCG